MNNADSIRRCFLDFFADNGHEVVHSAPMVPHNDPTLMFVNAGMVPFKHFFTGELQNKSLNLTSCQKCLRAGGKHNDLENVGYTERHHTFFEMLGNFSFGGYFKEEAIALAWEFIVKKICLNKQNLFVTIYETDEEAGKLWQKFLPKEKILIRGEEDNFWRMGDSGPCGPCSEIFYRFDDGQELEIWNLVFMQLYDDGTGIFQELPKVCVDTGMGLERVLAVVEGVKDNYDTSLFADIISSSQKMSGNNDNKVAHKVIADHLRAASFLIADGLMPSNTGRGYVLRRIIRRAIRYIYKIAPSRRAPFLPALFPALRDLMGGIYGELILAEDLIVKVLAEEEEKFQETLGNGMLLLDKALESLVAGAMLDGSVAFKLYDTFGFPLDLTQDILRERCVKLDIDGFDREMLAQRDRSIWHGSGEKQETPIWLELFGQFGATQFIEGVGGDAQVLALVESGKRVSEVLETNKEFVLLLDCTCFYGESGGQQGDRGTVIANSGGVSVVSDTQKVAGGLIVHYCSLKTGSIKVGDRVGMALDVRRRDAIAVNHSATHLLHHALRKVLGSRVVQKGSLVAQEYLRFDFSYNNKLSDQDIAEIEAIVQNMIENEMAVSVEIVDREIAVHKGAMALFGEKYGNKVRVVTMGDSMELCGGTHVANTQKIGLFKITGQEAVGSGLRRIKAVTGSYAIQHLNGLLDSLVKEIKSVKEEFAEAKKQSDKERQKMYSRLFKLEQSNQMLFPAGITLFVKKIDDFPINYVRAPILDEIKSASVALMTGLRCEKQTFLVLALADNIAKSLGGAKEVLCAALKGLDAHGGGNDVIAQASGFPWSEFPKMVERVVDFMTKKIAA